MHYGTVSCVRISQRVLDKFGIRGVYVIGCRALVKCVLNNLLERCISWNLREKEKSSHTWRTGWTEIENTYVFAMYLMRPSNSDYIISNDSLMMDSKGHVRKWS